MQGCCKVSSSICEARWALFDNQLGNEIGSFSDPFDAENAIEAGWTTGLVPFTYENGIGFIENMSAFETNFRFATQFGNLFAEAQEGEVYEVSIDGRVLDPIEGSRHEIILSGSKSFHLYREYESDTESRVEFSDFSGGSVPTIRTTLIDSDPLSEWKTLSIQLRVDTVGLTNFGGIVFNFGLSSVVRIALDDNELDLSGFDTSEYGFGGCTSFFNINASVPGGTRAEVDNFRIEKIN